VIREDFEDKGLKPRERFLSDNYWTFWKSRGGDERAGSNSRPREVLVN